MPGKPIAKKPLAPKPINQQVAITSDSASTLGSHYNGFLASDKFFSQKEINSKPSKRINAQLSKNTGPEVRKDQWSHEELEVESMRSSTSSFYTPGKEVAISEAQKERIRSRPFSGKFK